MKRLGIDLDGVLCDFNTKFIDVVIKVTGQDLFPPRPFDIPCWNYPEFYGYLKPDVTAVWDYIKSSSYFWECLPTYESTTEDLHQLYGRFLAGDDITFITSRPSTATITAKRQSELWLLHKFGGGKNHQFIPTVIVTSEKGDAARLLELDAYIDDRWENCLDVACTEDENAKNIGVKVYMVDRPWNRAYQKYAPTNDIKVVSNVTDMLREI